MMTQQNSADVEALSTLALDYLRSGRGQEAADICRQVLEIAPLHAATHHVAGVAAAQAGETAAAIEHLTSAVNGDPFNAAYRFNLGAVCASAGRLADAVRAYEEALALNPDMAEACVNLADALRKQRRLAEAADMLHRAIALRPVWPLPRVNLANVLHDQAEYDQALDSYRQALDLKSDYPEALVSMANTLCALGRFRDAEDACRTALAMAPTFVMGLSNLGNALQGQERLTEAISCFQQALSIDPGYAEAYSSLGSLYKEQEEHEKAEECYRKALEIDPNFAEAHSNLGIIYQFEDRLEEALESFEKAIAIRPDYPEAFSHIGTNYLSRGDEDQAIVFFEKALSLRPDYPEARYNRSLAYLKQGDWEHGWEEYEWRWKTVSVRGRWHSPTDDVWDGTALPAGSLLIQAEQGFGDSLQFSRYVPIAAERAGRVMFSAPAGLVRLFRSSFPDIEVLANDRQTPLCDAHVPLMSLARIFQTRPDSVPCDIPYLRPDPELVNKWAGRVDRGARLRVGLVWKAGHERSRSIPPEILAEIGGLPGVSFYGLQRRGLAEPLPSALAALNLTDFNYELDDFAETAAALLNLDLLISVDTSVPHLSGALGLPTWIMLPHVAEWRWGVGGDSSAWYPQARLFRQPARQDWQALVRQVRSELALAAERALISSSGR